MKKLVAILTIVVSLFTISCCKKDDPTPTVVAKDLTCNVTSTNVTTNGGHDGTITVVILTGNGDYIYSVNTTITNTNGLFTDLTAGVYHVKVVDSENKTFIKNVTITEPPIVPVKPTVVILAATSITYSTATLNGTVNPNGFVTTDLKFEYGTTTSYGKIATLTNVSGNTLTNVTKDITGLTASTIHHYRLISTNSGGTSISDDMTFTTLINPNFPKIDALFILNTDITSTSVKVNFTVHDTISTDDIVIYVKYGTSSNLSDESEKITINPSNGTGNSGTIIINGLTSSTSYYYELVVTNSYGTTSRNGDTFKTSTIPPIVSMNSPTINFNNTVTFSGSVTPNVPSGTPITIYFEYSIYSDYSNDNPTPNGSYGKLNITNVGGFTSISLNITSTNLMASTPYYSRLVVDNGSVTPIPPINKQFTTN